MTQIKKFISESFAWPGYGYVTMKGAGTWFASIGARLSTKIRRFSFRLKAKKGISDEDYYKHTIFSA